MGRNIKEVDLLPTEKKRLDNLDLDFPRIKAGNKTQRSAISEEESDLWH